MILTCLRAGKEVFRETKQLALIDPNSGPKPGLKAEELAVLDPGGRRQVPSHGPRSGVYSHHQVR